MRFLAFFAPFFASFAVKGFFLHHVQFRLFPYNLARIFLTIMRPSILLLALCFCLGGWAIAQQEPQQITFRLLPWCDRRLAPRGRLAVIMQ